MSSIASSRRSSRSPSITLTPRSKLKSLLAAFDDESDKENDTARKDKDSPIPPPNNVYRSKVPLPQHSTTDTADNGDDHNTSISEATRGDEENRAPMSAYERVRQQLLRPSDDTRQAQDPVPSTPATPTSKDAEQSILTSSSRKRKRVSDETESFHISRSASPSSPSAQSPGLFVSPHGKSREMDSDAEDSASDLPDLSNAGARLKALVAQKRAERIARENALNREQSSRGSEDTNKPETKKPKQIRVVVQSESDSDPEVSKKLTQQARPTRKASKRALEEMSRETQRMSRNMQLTYEARTKTKFTTQDLFAKFNFRQSAVGASSVAQPAKDIGSSSPLLAHSDTDAASRHSTPPSSPPSASKTDGKVKIYFGDGVPADTTEVSDAEEQDLPSLADILSQSKALPSKKRNVKDIIASVKGQKGSSRLFIPTDDTDDGLEITIPTKSSKTDIFDRLPAPEKRDSRTIQTLRALAHLHSPESRKKRTVKSMTPGELHFNLRRKAREQALLEKAEKIQALRDRGVVIQTSEEKERDQLEIESLVEKARIEAEELAKKEKEAAKKNGTLDESHLPDSEDEDEDWDGSIGDEDDEEAQLSGSEDENEAVGHNSDDEDEADDGEEEDELAIDHQKASAFFDDQASEEGSDGDDEATDGEAEAEEEEPSMPSEIRINPRNARRKTVVLADEDEEDDDDDEVAVVPSTPLVAITPKTPKSVVAGLFGLTTGPAELGLTQIFAGTMSDEQTQDIDALRQPQNSLEFPPTAPSPLNPMFGLGEDDVADSVVEDSQNATLREPETPIRLRSDAMGSHALSPSNGTPMSELPEPTQDMGFQAVPIGSFPTASYSTIDTELLPERLELDADRNKKRGRLVRRANLADATGDGVTQIAAERDENDENDAFTIMRRAAHRPSPVKSFDKKRSEAKDMFEEQAEESEDEYAGLGGASDDDSQGDLDEDTKKMIDDDGNEIVDEQQLAAFFADNERVDDEKRVEKLFKDINGGWRRKRGADIDFSDSDDDGAERRRAKQREFARMRRALLADEKLGKIAENPKQQAFLQAIEDRDIDEDLDLFNDTEPSQASKLSQDSLMGMQPPRTSNNANDRHQRNPRFEAQAMVSSNSRRSRGITKPTSILQIRSVLSELIGESESALAFQADSGSDQDGDLEGEGEDYLEDNDDFVVPDTAQTDAAVNELLPPNIQRRRTLPNSNRATVIDRMALRRSASLQSAAAEGAQDGRLAFHSTAFSRASTGFRPPSLLRRATTNSSASFATSTTGVASLGRSNSLNSASGEGAGKETVKMNGGLKKSSVNYYIREKERMARVEQVEKERIEGRERIGRMRKGRMGAGLGVVGVGLFEG